MCIKSCAHLSSDICWYLNALKRGRLKMTYPLNKSKNLSKWIIFNPIHLWNYSAELEQQSKGKRLAQSCLDQLHCESCSLTCNSAFEWNAMRHVLLRNEITNVMHHDIMGSHNIKHIWHGKLCTLKLTFLSGFWMVLAFKTILMSAAHLNQMWCGMFHCTMTSCTECTATSWNLTTSNALDMENCALPNWLSCQNFGQFWC